MDWLDLYRIDPLVIWGHGIASTQRRLWCPEHIAGAQVSLDNHELSYVTVTICP